MRRLMKRYFYIFLMPALVLLASCHKEGEEEPTVTHFGRTVIVYMAMQNSLGSSGYHKADSTEIVNAMGYIPKDDRMLLFIDDAKKPRIYELNSQLAATNPKTGLPYGPKLVKAWDTEVSSASPRMVTEVLEFMRQNYESDSYGLVMGSHATGWLPTDRSTSGNSARRDINKEDFASSNRRKTFGIDVGPEGSMRNDEGVAGSVADQIEIPDLAKAISLSGVHLSFLLFDACLMQCIEVDYDLRDVSDYVIASPISISAEGAYYTDLVRKGLFSSDAVDVARTYAEYYKGEGSIPYSDSYGTVISCVRSAAIVKLASTVRALLADIVSKRVTAGLAGSDDDVISVLKRVDISSALNYHPYSWRFYYRPHFYDIISGFEALGASPEQLLELRVALDDLVVYKGATEDFWIGPYIYDYQTMPASEEEWCGVSMFVPQQIYTSNASDCNFGDLNEAFKATQWYKDVFAGL